MGKKIEMSQRAETYAISNNTLYGGKRETGRAGRALEGSLGETYEVFYHEWGGGEGNGLARRSEGTRETVGTGREKVAGDLTCEEGEVGMRGVLKDLFSLHLDGRNLGETIPPERVP